MLGVGGTPSDSLQDFFFFSRSLPLQVFFFLFFSFFFGGGGRGGRRFQVPCSNFLKDFFEIKSAAGMGVVGRGSGFCRCNLNRDTI